MDGYFNVSSPFGRRLLSYTDHTKTTYFHLDSLISLALLSNVATLVKNRRYVPNPKMDENNPQNHQNLNSLYKIIHFWMTVFK